MIWSNMVKRILIGLLILCLAIAALIFYGLHLMDVEDRYGHLQSLYWESKDGDLIVNKLNSNIGIVELNDSRIFVKDGNRLIDVEEWLDQEDKRKFQVAIYRPEQSIEKLDNLNMTDLISKCRLITEVAVEY